MAVFRVERNRGYPQTRAAEESGSFLEQDSTTVPKSAYLRFCPLW